MKTSPLHEIKLHLNDIHHLFVAPEFDAFSDQPFYGSGLDEIIKEVKNTNRRSEFKISLFLPAGSIAPELTGKTRLALDRYCTHMVEESRRETALLRWEGFEALQTGLVFMAICLSISLYISKQAWIPELIQTFIGQGLSVVAWVSMWKPIDIFLYQWWPHWHTRFVFQKIKRAELVVLPVE